MYNKVRNLSLALACLLLLSSAVQAATIIVDNNPAHAADYRTLQEAVDGATAGDTILVGPSFGSASYGDANVTKQLKIYGTGYFLDENGYQTGGNDSIVGSIQFYQLLDSEYKCLSIPDGSIIAGLFIKYGVSVSGSGVGGHISCPDIHNIVVTRNYSEQGFSFQHGINIVVSNNRVTNISLGYGTGVIRNNEVPYGVSCYEADILMVNNSMFSSSTFGNINSSYACSGDAYNNIGVGLSNNSFSSVNIHDNFFASLSDLQSLVYTWTGSSDAMFQLRATSPAKGACLNGADCGAFAGATPYILSGLPPRPRITNLEVPATVFGTSTTMPVKVSAEGRN